MDKEPISKFVDLFNTNQLPSLLNEGIMDPQILKHYLVLHDQQEGPQEMYRFSLILFFFVNDAHFYKH
jgi:trafficking protein particle complex subunit 8